MDGGAWEATVHEVTKSQTGLSDFTFTFYLLHHSKKVNAPTDSPTMHLQPGWAQFLPPSLGTCPLLKLRLAHPWTEGMTVSRGTYRSSGSRCRLRPRARVSMRPQAQVHGASHPHPTPTLLSGAEHS